jgi:hypothetical protein
VRALVGSMEVRPQGTRDEGGEGQGGWVGGGGRKGDLGRPLSAAALLCQYEAWAREGVCVWRGGRGEKGVGD